MERTQVIENIRQVAARVLPKGSALYRYMFTMNVTTIVWNKI